MTKSIPSIINPSMLAWARKSAGYDLQSAASKLQIDPDIISSWENGSAYPTYPQLEKIAEAYNRPTALFYLRTIPKEFALLQDHRRLPGVQGRYTPQLIFEIRKARERREVALDLLAALGEIVPTLGLVADNNEPPNVLAERIRASTGISSQQINSCRDNRTAFYVWAQALEAMGILVFQTDSKYGPDVAEMRAASIYYETLPIILINSSDAWAARIFSLFHEVGHIALRSQGICIPQRIAPNSAYNDDIEVFCNQVSASVLMPANLVNEKLDSSEKKVREWSDERIYALSEYFHVSREAMLRRLVTLNYADICLYQAKREEYDKDRSEQTSEQNAKPFFTTPYNKALKSNGLFFTSVVLDAVNGNKVSLRDASNYLDLKVRWFTHLQHAVLRRSMRVLA